MRTVSHILLRGIRNFIVGTVIVMYVIVQRRSVKFGEITVRLHMHHPIGEGRGRGLNIKLKVVRRWHPHRGLQQSRGPLHHPSLPHLLRHQWFRGGEGDTHPTTTEVLQLSFLRVDSSRRSLLYTQSRCSLLLVVAL